MRKMTCMSLTEAAKAATKKVPAGVQGAMLGHPPRKSFTDKIKRKETVGEKKGRQLWTGNIRKRPGDQRRLAGRRT